MADGGYASRITHTFYAFARPRCRRGPPHHVLRTRIPDSSEKWRPTGVTPHALRIRITHLHAQGVGEGLRTTYYAYVLRPPPQSPLCARTGAAARAAISWLGLYVHWQQRSSLGVFLSHIFPGLSPTGLRLTLPFLFYRLAALALKTSSLGLRPISPVYTLLRFLNPVEQYSIHTYTYT